MSSQSNSSPSRLNPQAIFESYLGNLPCAVFWKDLELVYRGCNEKFLDLFAKKSKAEVMGKSEFDLLSVIDADKMARIDQQVLGNGESVQDIEERIKIRGEDRFVTLLTSRSPLLNSRGETVGVLGTYVDITEIRNVEEELVEHQHALEQRNQVIEQDLQNASQIQRYLMGKEAPECDFLEIHYKYRYMDKVGGDFVTFKNLDDDAYSFLLADLTGHGVTAALFMALLKYIAKEAPDEVRSLPAYFLSYLDMEFFGQIPDGFFTAIAGTARYDPETKQIELEYSNAAHPSAVIARKDGSHELLGNGEFAVGLLDFVQRQSHTTILNEGDRIYLYSDGFIESTDIEGEEFGFDNLLKVFIDLRELPISDAVDRIFETINEYTGSDEAQDDMTILAIDATAFRETKKPEPILDW